MNNSCYVPGCKSGYSSCKEKVSLFGAPKDEHRRNKWNLVIPRLDKVISAKDVVCEKHFKSEDIIRTWKSADIEIKLKKPKLLSTAVPSIFPKNVNYKPRCKSKHMNKIIVKRNNKVKQLFHVIWKKRHLIEMPSPEWGLHSLVDDDMKRTIVISECEISDIGVPHYRKQMHISETRLKLHFYVGDKQILEPVLLAQMWPFVIEIKNRFALQRCLNSWHAVRVCDGGPTTNIYQPKKITTNIACPTPNGLWRHQHCTVLYYDQNQCCKQCYTLYDLFKQQFSIRVYSPIQRNNMIKTH